VVIIKSTGIVRAVDDLGRIVIPKELRKTMNINSGDSLEIYTEENKIIFQPYKPGCMFCGEMDNTITFKGRVICKSCLAQMNNR
jgi:transcriptional pleiotropic regulator of transition state genes